VKIPDESAGKIYYDTPWPEKKRWLEAQLYEMAGVGMCGHDVRAATLKVDADGSLHPGWTYKSIPGDIKDESIADLYPAGPIKYKQTQYLSKENRTAVEFLCRQNINRFME